MVMLTSVCMEKYYYTGISSNWKITLMSTISLTSNPFHILRMAMVTRPST